MFATSETCSEASSGIRPSVSIQYEEALGAFLRGRGYSAAGATGLRQAGALPGRVDGCAYAERLLGASRELDDPGLGLAFGARIGGAGFGLLGIAAATAPTLRESIEHLTRLESLTSTLGYVTARHTEGWNAKVSLVWQPLQPLPPVVVEGILAGWVSFGRYLLGERADVLQVSFAHRRSAPWSDYEDVLASPVAFDAGEYAVTIPATLLEARSRFADAGLNAAMTGWLGHCAAAVAATAPANQALSWQISNLLGSRLALAEADEDRVATALGLGRRSLQRRLLREGTSFRHILDAARAQHAVVSLLRGEASLLDLSADVGFDEQSSLCRAFRKWTGYAPLTFKNRLAGMYRQLRSDDAGPAGFAPFRLAAGHLVAGNHQLHTDCGSGLTRYPG